MAAECLLQLRASSSYMLAMSRAPWRAACSSTVAAWCRTGWLAPAVATTILTTPRAAVARWAACTSRHGVDEL